ncbi:hypothetical protein [Paenibacillus sp. GCM10027626]|uniref:hypothetical protein n=1 Tax=Paenibacillus sp. GCM10027626 TaxID=3273411 RepID=UPI00363D6791
MGIRKDWLDNVGIDKLPETLDEYHEVLRRFTFNDPDQNGKNDMYGGHGIQLYLRGAFGFGSGTGIYADERGGLGMSFGTIIFMACRILA